MYDDVMLSAYKIGALGGFLQAHVKYTVAAEDGIVQFHRGECFHLFCFGRVAAGIELNAVERDDVADALFRVVVEVLGLDRLNQDTAHVKAVVLPSRERFLVCDDMAVLLLRTHLYLVVVGMLMCDKDDVCTGVIAVPREGVNIDYSPVAGGKAEASVALIVQFGHDVFPFIGG